MGTAHGGHDQCAWCYFQYIKPQLAAERKEVKRRRALKKGLAQTPSPETRALIDKLDLEQQNAPPQPNHAIRDAITDIEIDRMLEGKTEDQQIETLVMDMVRRNTPDLPIMPAMPPAPPEPSVPVEEETTDVTKVAPEDRKNRFTNRVRRDPLSDEEKRDITDAFAAGISVDEIRSTWRIGIYTIYQLVDAAGLPRRGRGGAQKGDQSMAEQKAVSVLAVEQTPPNGAVSGLTEWVVTYTVTKTETTIVAAKGFSDAASSVSHTVPGCDVISVAKKLP